MRCKSSTFIVYVPLPLALFLHILHLFLSAERAVGKKHPSSGTCRVASSLAVSDRPSRRCAVRRLQQCDSIDGVRYPSQCVVDQCDRWEMKRSVSLTNSSATAAILYALGCKSCRVSREIVGCPSRLDAHRCAIRRGWLAARRLQQLVESEASPGSADDGAPTSAHEEGKFVQAVRQKEGQNSHSDITLQTAKFCTFAIFAPIFDPFCTFAKRAFLMIFHRESNGEKREICASIFGFG